MKNEHILVTGGAGFIGSNLVKRLLNDNRSVICVDDFNNYYSSTINNTGDITVTDDVVNHGTVHNDGNFEIDGNYTGSGDVDGTGSLCNSDGVTDPTGGAKSVSCPICGDGGSLPVELINFSATYDTKVVTLSWVTASEINNDKFEIEKSKDGIEYEVVGTILGNGNSNTIQEYSFEDNNTESGITYYRLAQIDFDGSISYSEIITISIQEKLEVKLYPNPVKTGEQLNLTLNRDGEKTIEVYDISGKLLRRLKTFDNYYLLNTNNLRRGMYLIRIISEKDLISKRLQIQ